MEIIGMMKNIGTRMMTGMTTILVETGQKRNIAMTTKAMTGKIGKMTMNTETTTATTTAEKVRSKEETSDAAEDM
eukprot:6306707-Pyramimonas_sp.AAC.1